MDVTTFLASLWGPTLLAVAFGVLTNRSYYVRIYRDLEKNALTVLVLGMTAMGAGLAHVQLHTVWSTTPAVIVSLLGWGLLLKGALFAIAPTFVDKAGNAWAKRKLIPTSGALMLVVGGYLTWFAYFA